MLLEERRGRGSSRGQLSVVGLGPNRNGAPGKPDTAANSDDGADGKAAPNEKAGKNEDTSDGQAGRDVDGTADRGRSGEHRQDG